MGTARGRLGPLPIGRWRSLQITVAVVIAALTLAVAPLGPARAAEEVGPSRVYFPQTGHYLSYGFLNYWHRNGDIPIFGYPITEEMRDAASGLTIQYFERAVFEWHPETPATWRVQLRRLGADVTADRVHDPAFAPVRAASDSSCTFYPETGHRLCFGFRNFWETNGGLPNFGYPISEEFKEGGRTVQYFERARFEWWPELRGTAFEVQLGLLGTDVARDAEVDRSPVPHALDVPVYEPGLWYVPAPPGPADVRTPPPGAPSGQAKWIEIDLSDQYLRAWEYQSVVFGTWVSTGLPRYPTPTGTFQIIAKLRYDDMSGGTPGVDYYYLPDVPYVMYFWNAYAIHGTYWHSNFGTPMSHGCVNLPTDAAAWVYNWAPYGTTVWIHK